MELLEQLSHCIEFGKINQASPYPPDMKGQDGADELAKMSLDQGIGANDILQKGLVPGMERVGVKFRENKVFVPQVLMSAKAMSAAMVHLKPFFASGEVERKGKFVIGTVAGDLHDIGKNLVGIMLKGAGFEVIDLGRDVPPDKFVNTAKEMKADIIGLSALLTTTLPVMKKVVELVKEKCIIDNVKIIVGGAPLSDEYAAEIGAHSYCFDGINAVDCAKRIIGKG